MNRRRGIPFVVSAPSGTGKTTVCRELVRRDDQLEFSVSHTTRPSRDGEVSGEHYQFIDRAGFEALVERGAFLEHAEYAGHLYGTSWRAIDEPLEAGRDLLLEIEVQGARQIRERRDDARFIFLLPPSRAELERRLRDRGTNSEAEIEERLALMNAEFAAVRDFDLFVVNRELEACIAAVQEIIAAERRGASDEVRERFGRASIQPELAERLRL